MTDSPFGASDGRLVDMDWDYPGCTTFTSCYLPIEQVSCQNWFLSKINSLRPKACVIVAIFAGVEWVRGFVLAPIYGVIGAL